MLERLLELIAGGSIQSLDDIARQMNIPSSLVNAMLSDLERMGYLKKISASCDKTCSGCPSQSMCGLIGGGDLWSVTEKGMQVAGRHPTS
jgi:DNA-binding Lrp family transcriptional regulator